IRTTATDSCRRSNKYRGRVVRAYYNCADRTTGENVCVDSPAAARKRKRRIDRTHQSRGCVGVVDAVKPGAKEAATATISFARTDVQNRRVRRRQRQGANGQRLCIIKNWSPVCSAVG